MTEIVNCSFVIAAQEKIEYQCSNGKQDLIRSLWCPMVLEEEGTHCPYETTQFCSICMTTQDRTKYLKIMSRQFSRTQPSDALSWVWIGDPNGATSLLAVVKRVTRNYANFVEELLWWVEECKEQGCHSLCDKFVSSLADLDSCINSVTGWVLAIIHSVKIPGSSYQVLAIALSELSHKKLKSGLWNLVPQIILDKKRHSEIC